MNVEISTLETWNRAVFLNLNAGPATPPALLVAAELLANGLIYAVPVALILMWLRGDGRSRAAALRALFVSAIALGLAQAIGLLWPHPRPFMIGLGHAWVQHSPDASLPSDHVTVFASVGLSLLLGGAAPEGATVLAIGLAVAWARIFVGVHFPLDMLAALGVAGLAWAVVRPLWARWGERVTRQVERIYRGVLAVPIARHWLRR